MTFIALYSGMWEKLWLFKHQGDILSFPERVPDDAKFPGSLYVYKGIVDEKSFGRIQFVFLQNPCENHRVRLFQVEAIGKIGFLK